MKKLLIASVALGCAAAVVAQTATSANIVGYKKNVQPSAGFLIFAPAQFGGAAGGITLDDAVDGLVGGEQIFIYNGSTYDIYDYFAGYGWFDGLFNLAGGVVIPAGAGSWLSGAASSETITAGEVPMAATVDVPVAAGFNLVANPYPVALALDDIDVSSFTGGEQVFVYNGSTYDIYDYFAGYGWFDGLFNPAGSVQVPVGEGFWLSVNSGTTLVFNKLF